MELSESLQDRVEGANKAHWVVVLVIGILLPSLSMIWLPMSGDIAMGCVSLLVCVGVVVGTRLQVRLRSLPLELAPVAARRGDVGYLRAWLGRGRVIGDVQVDATWRANGDTTSTMVSTRVFSEQCIGPFLIELDVPRSLQEAGGRIEVRVQGMDGDLPVRLERNIPDQAIQTGRFAPALLVENARVVWMRENWATVSD